MIFKYNFLELLEIDPKNKNYLFVFKKSKEVEYYTPEISVHDDQGKLIYIYWY